MYRLLWPFILGLLLLSCKTIVKKELPVEDNPPMVTYSKVTNVSSLPLENYDNLIKEVYRLCPQTKSVLEDKPKGYFQLISYSAYDYRGSDRKFSFLITCELRNSKCYLTINGIHIMHYPIERIYFNEKRHNLKKFNSSYEDIDKRINGILTFLTGTLK